ncbi:MAG: DUF4396 domain-containing protein [Armatimonadota bacterium]
MTPGTVDLLPPRARQGALLGTLIGLVLFGLIGMLAEAGLLGLPRLEPLFASPLGAVTALLAIIGGMLGALIGSLLSLPSAPLARPADGAVVQVTGTDDQEAVTQLAHQYGGTPTDVDSPPSSAAAEDPMLAMTPLRWLAWGIALLSAAVILTATAYIWWLSMAYGHGSDQVTRIGYTLKNVQRIPADTPPQAGQEMLDILGGPAFPAPADPIAAAILAPQAAARGATLVYGAAQDAGRDYAALAADGLRQLAGSPVIVVIADQEPAYALPAAYTAAQFGAPVVPLINGELPPAVTSAMQGMREKLLLVATPTAVPPNTLRRLSQYGRVRVVASPDVYRHALLWARGRWGRFGWGMDERWESDGYYYFALANPNDPGFAAAGLPMAYQGNYGPLLYTHRTDLDTLTGQYLWRLSPNYFVVPTEGPFINLRVLGGPESVAYSAQARADLATEIHAYRAQVTGLSGLAALGWMWFVIGLLGAIWTLFALPRRVPNVMFYPRLFWPLAVLVLGPVGLLALFLAYQGRSLMQQGPMWMSVRPSWAKAVGATIMGLGIGMALMIASMYLFQLNGMPLTMLFAFTPLFWLGAPMFTVMWLIMVVPAILLSSFLFMGPMMAEMRQQRYLQGVRMALPVVAISMVSASLGMFTLIWYWMNFHPLMIEEDLWLWVAPIWWGAFIGFLTALIPNYLLVKYGWKPGGM